MGAEPACPCSHPPGHVVIQAGGEGGGSGREIVSGGAAQAAIPAWVQPGQAGPDCFLFIYDLFCDFA